MAGQRQPIDLVIARGKKHLTQAEIEERRASEVAPCADDIKAPAYLSAKQKRHFDKLVRQLDKIKIMGETDVDTLARYVVAETQYQEAVKELRRLAKDRPTDRDDEGYYTKVETWAALQDIADKRQERYFKQAATLARDLGLTISSRCKLQVPTTEAPEKPVNKFAKFGGGRQ